MRKSTEWFVHINIERVKTKERVIRVTRKYKRNFISPND